MIITELIGTISTVMISTITETEMYWLTRMSRLHNGVFGIGLTFAILTGIVLVVSMCCWAMGDSVEKLQGKKFSKIALPCFVLSVLITASNIFIPTTKEMCAIKAIPVIVNNEQVQELPNKVVELANDWIDELKPNKED